MRFEKKIPITFILLALACFSQAREIKTKATLDSVYILIGDQTRLHLEIEYDNDLTIQFPEVNDSLTDHVEIWERSPIDTITIDEKRIKLMQDFIVTSFDTGQHVIPPFYFKLSYGDMHDSVPTNPLQLNVFTIPKIDSLMAAYKAPLDIKPPYEAPITFKEIAPWIMGSLLLAGLIFLIFYAIQRRKNNKPIFGFPEKPREPAHVIALRELDKIKVEKIWQQGKTKEYWSLVSDTLREYIDNRFDIPALEQTSDETINAFKFRRSLVNEKSFENLKEILEKADLVKFAKFEPMPDDNNLALVDAYFFVDQTKLIVKLTDETQPEDDNEGEDVIVK